MKTILLLCLSILILHPSFSQPGSYLPNPAIVPIPSYRIEVCTGKTTNLIFKYDIISVDRGNQSLLVQKVKPSQNILQIKAGTENFSETNLTVVTADKKLYSIIASYATSPAILNYRFLKSSIDTAYHIPTIETIPARNDLTVAETSNYSDLVSGIQSSTRIKDEKFGVSVRLRGIFIKENVFFFSLQLQNKTPVRYDIESLSMLIKDQQQGKKTATQEIQMDPMFIYGNESWIDSMSDQQLVIAVPKFTIPDKKVFIIQIREANGGRHLGFRVKNKTLLKAKTL